MEDVTPSEPLFRANKRRKVFRKRANSEQETIADNVIQDSEDAAAGQDESESEELGSSGVVRLQKRAAVKKRGIGFTSSDAVRNSEEVVEEGALVVANEDGTKQTIHGDRFVKPTGRVAVAENKHMVSYIDSKMAEMRSATSTQPNGTTALDHSGVSPDSQGIKHQQEQQGASSPTKAASGPVTFDQAQARSTRVYERPTKRRRPPQRDQTDFARDSIIEQIMQESQVPLYDRSGSHTPANDVDNDSATAEAFKAQLLAEMEEQNRRRLAPRNPAVKDGTSMQSGPKLGGSRSQRAKMLKLEEAKAKGKDIPGKKP